jgi:squalene-hopene/tetraprenyl-beta-curcumene cyclase
MNRSRWWTLLAALFAALGGARADEAASKTNMPEEPMASRMSLTQTARFLDATALQWTRERKCGSCHTNYPYLMARPLLHDTPSSALSEVRKFFETRAANWESGKAPDKPRWDTEVVATAVALAVNDAHTTGRLHPMTRKALDKMWTLQKSNGAWNWLKCSWPPMEYDDYFGAVYAAVGVALAPEGYADSTSAQAGLAKLHQYFQKTPVPNLHHKTWLLWAATKHDSFVPASERAATVKELLAVQRADGGWSLPSLGDWKGHHKRPNNKNAPSDGYATGLAVFVLRQAGVPAEDERIRKGVVWLKDHQRVSGLWFTHSLNADHDHYISHAGTAFAVLALKACGVEGKARSE